MKSSGILISSNNTAPLTELIRRRLDIQGFKSWLEKRCPSSVTTYLNEIVAPLKLYKRYSVLAYRLAIHYLYESGEVDLRHYLDMLKVPKTEIDLYVPSIEDVITSLKRIDRGDVRKAYLILISSGIRLSECIKLLNIYEKSELIQRGTVFLYPLNWVRGYKSVFYAFIPETIAVRLERIKLSRNMVSNYCIRRNLVRPKYLRKFMATKMFELGVPSEVIDFIQGRVPRSILARHYLKLQTIAVKEYRKYAEWLENSPIMKTK